MDALKGYRIIVMTTLREVYEANYDGRPPFYEIGCAGIVTVVVDMEVSTFTERVRRVVKFRVTAEDESRSYRLARVGQLPEVLYDREKSLLAKHRQRLEALITKGSDSKVTPGTSDEELVNTVAQYFPMGLADRQGLLEMKNAVLRALTLIQMIESKVAPRVIAFHHRPVRMSLTAGVVQAY